MGVADFMKKAILLVGPTSSGKSPLGDTLQELGYLGQDCVHFDFGEELRRVASGKNVHFDIDESVQVAEILDACRLLDQPDYWIAERILRSYQNDPRLMVLNGFPRDVPQAEMMDTLVSINKLIILDAPLEVLLERIRLNTGGDRTGRDDDSHEKVQLKLKTYQDRTTPIVRHYFVKGIEPFYIPVEADTTPEMMYSMLHNN
ncbi:MAG: nucleoside monophosphate kinase [Nanoarchaeota archaeon]|nr:nucleoside monophosphate kinase [Nanoarchaeota archaeon]